LNISSESLTKLQSIISSKKITPWKKEQAVKHKAGGLCARCGSYECIPTQIATYEVTGITVLEKYCDECLELIPTPPITKSNNRNPF